MLGNKPLQEIENLKMATKGLIHYIFSYLLIYDYDEMSLHIVLYLVKIDVVILKMGGKIHFVGQVLLHCV